LQHKGDPEGLYAALGLRPGAPISAVVAAHRRLARELHPDAGGSAQTLERFYAVQRAYERLRDPADKAGYDRSAVPGTADGVPARRRGSALADPEPENRHARRSQRFYLPWLDLSRLRGVLLDVRA
jgi:curved DNA-binding protein CbpA